jgi:hypothetical protein
VFDVKRLIIKSVLFAVSVTILLEVCGFIVAETLEPVYFKKIELRWLGSPKVNPSVVFLGASTMRHAVSPTIVANRVGLAAGEVINLAFDARTPPMSLSVWRDLLSLHSNVKLVFYSIEPWLMSEKYHGFDDFETLQWSLPQKTYATLRPIAFPDDLRARLPRKNHFLNLARISTAIVSNVGKPRVVHEEPPADFGGVAKTGNLGHNPQSEEICRFYSPRSLFNISKLYVERLSELKKLAEQAGAQFVLALPPLPKSVVADYEINCSGQVDTELISAIRKYLGPVAVVGSFRLFHESHDSIHFADMAHLNTVGQARFSMFIADHIRAASFRPEPLKSLIRY